ncbi:MAG: mannose-1-phosphate guanylyltransferase [Candidatus Margulisbacteria bacterium]|jgi:mannose-1-phosphate guanylyltransferase/mannose-6-phosphate isomerase|nr:mannose-1-phosphate guanylyltransferase [Candidatus Margulisiibacteriota bacterium]
MAELFVFILAGGSGTRLAPLSLTMAGRLPKQFLPLVGERTMLRQTLDRIPKGRLIVVPEERYAPAVREQCGGDVQVLAEPFGCNTAAAAGLCALYALRETGSLDTLLFFLPADHIMDKQIFARLFARALAQAKTGKIVTIGVTPDRPDTGYGYIQTAGSGPVLPVLSFVEKPDLPTAQKYLAAGNYFWNAGIFAMQTGVALDALRRDAPEIYAELRGIDFAKDLSAEIARQYQKIKDKKQNISIDYAVMEKEAKNMLLIPAPATLDWNDVGGWIALKKYYPQDAAGNLIINYTPDRIQISGLRDALVVDTENGILLCPQALAPRAKEIIPGIEKGLRTECLDCENIATENTTERYIGVLGLSRIRVFYRAGFLRIDKI